MEIYNFWQQNIRRPMSLCHLYAIFMSQINKIKDEIYRFIFRRWFSPSISINGCECIYINFIHRVMKITTVHGIEPQTDVKRPIQMI